MKKLITLFLIFISINSFSQNPLLLKDVVPGNNTGTIQQIVKTTNYTFFNENDGGAATDRSLYRTDGTPGGTIKLNLSYPGYISTKADKLTALGNKVIFAGDNISQYGEIWSSDGTQPGTVALERFQPISNRIPVVEISAIGSYAYYSVINKDAGNINRAYLRRTDGTAAGTSLVYDFSAFTGIPEVVFLTPVNNILYFIVYDAGGTGVDQLWRSDGTNAGTYMVYNFTTANFVESYIMPAGNTMYIMIGSVIGGIRQNTIWKSDGTAAGTVPVKFVGTGNTNLYPPFAAIGSTLYFAGADGNGKELWQTNGTVAGTYMIADINPGGGNSVPSFLTAFNNNLYFAAENPTYGGELWKYDGSVATLVKDINPGNAASVPQGFVVSGNSLIFSALNNTSGRELWVTDGTTANTVMIADINPGANSSSPNIFTPGDPVFFAANNGTNGFEVFKYNNNGEGIGGPNKFYVNDNSTTGDLLTLGIGSNSNNGSKLYPFATISYAVTQTTEGDTIYVDAGTYVEQVTLDKGITIIGAGQDLTSILKPAVTIAPPGSFFEQGVIQTAQSITGDVHISDLSVTGDLITGVTPVIIQSGGSVKNCKLQNGNQGIFVRIDPAINLATKTFVVDGNTINAEYIAVNFAGTRLTATLSNNTIATFNPGFSTGVFAGTDFGTLTRLTVTGNIFSSYVTDGLFVNTNNGIISQNSFLGTGQKAINKSGGSTINAACNWYGSPLAATVKSKVNAGVIYSPWLINGTDNSVAVGFQTSSTCPVANSFYVNDNNQSGDIYTTAIGSNTNNGSSSAPFATLSYALSQVAANDIIYVDAGNYAEQVIIDKGITIIGAGQNLSSFTPPATPLVPAPGPFTEIGLFETTPGISSVHISNLSINSNGASQNIIIQSGGSVTNCKLLNGGQGIFFRVDPSSPPDPATNLLTRTAVIENNTIEPNGIGINCQGSRLTATIRNNIISKSTGYYAGIFAGLDFGPVPQLTISNNIITNYFGIGLEVNSNIGNYNNNSFSGTNGAPAIRKSSGNTPNATCNWYGSALAATVTPQIIGTVTYSPWLIDGTDNSPVIGFQSSATCPVANSFYVNDNSQSGDIFTTAIGNNANPGTFNAPFATISHAINQVPAGATIYVDAGTFIENVVVNKALTLKGAKTGNCPGASLTEGDETIILPPTTNLSAGNLVNITAANVTIDGFMLDGDNPALTSSYNMNGADVDGFTAINNNTAAAINMQVVNCIIKNFNRNGIGMVNNITGIIISCNHIDNLARLVGTQGIFSDARAVNMFGNNYGTITNNYFTRVSTGIIISSATTAAAPTPVLANNTISSYTTGILFQSFTGTATPYEVTGNAITTADYAQWNVTGQINPATNANWGIRLSGTTFNNTSNFTNNNISDCNFGMYVTGVTCVTGALNFTNNNISGSNYGMNISQVIAPGNINISGGSISGSNQSGVFYNASATNNSKLNMDGVSLTNNNITLDAAYASGSALPLQFSNTTISGGTIGLRLSGNISVAGGTLSGINFSGQSADYIQLINNSFQGQVIDATSLTFEGLTGAEMTLPGLFNTEDKIAHSIDYAGVGFLKVKPLNIFLTQNSFNTTLPIPWGTATSSADLLRAVGAAVNGDTIRVDAGTYSSGNFTIDKSLTLLGTNYLISPNDISDPLLNNSSRNTEAIISNSQITLAADNIRIQGFTFNTPTSNQFVLSSTAVTNNLCNNIKLEKNRFVSSTSASNVMVLNGKAVSPATTNNFLIHDNRMENATAAYMRIDNFNIFTITKNTFIRTVVPTNAIAIRQNGGRIENLTVEENVFQYWDATVFTGGAAVKNFVYNNNKAYNTLRGVQFNAGPTEPISLTITNNLFQQHPTAGSFSSLFISRNSALNAATPNSIHIEANTFTYESTGQVNIPPSLVNVICNNNSTSGDPLSSNYQLTFRKNIINYTGNLSGSSNLSPHGLRFEGKLAVANIDNNEITYTGINLPIAPVSEILRSSGIFIANTSVIPPGAVLNINNNKVYGFSQSIAFYNGAAYGGISPGVIANINNNSFTGDLLSINNGTTSQSVNANCNWYGSVTAQDVASKVSNGSVIYSPWLTNGTDSDVTTGFQPVPGTCNGTPVVITLNSATNISCFGANNGAIAITVSGGTTPYTIAWSKGGNPFSTNEDLTNLSPGSYSVTVTDANGSVASITGIAISEPLLLTASASGSNVSCFGGSNGSASVTVGGGTLPYTYLWSNGGANANISNVAAGIYSVTVTDGNGCTKTASYQVTQPTLLTAVASGTSTSCANTATVVASGGTLPYSYAWNNGAPTQSITSIPAGTYTVIVTDNKGCTASSSVTVTATEAFNPSASVTNVSCFGGNNGSITVTNVNGAGPFQFSLNGVNFSAPSSLPYTFPDGLVAGIYTVTVKDANGCTGFVEKTITQPPVLTLVNTVQGTCYGQNTGSITVTGAGGSGSLGYSWSGPAGYTSTQKNISGLATGNYSLTVTDGNGCTKSLVNVVVPTTSQVNVTPVVTNIACKGEVNGSISIAVTGGTGSGFNYLWNTGATANSISNLGTGNYTVTITDIGSGCVVTRSYSITQPSSAISLSAVSTNVTGCNSLGTITATGSGGTPGYTYKLDAGTYQTSGLFTGLNAGTYTVWVKDDKGCTKSVVKTITDGGGDDYESNNSKNQSKAINTGATISARIATAADVADWFKFTTTSAGNYTLTFTHPSASFIYNTYAAGNNTPALTPVSSTANSKTYTLAASTTYYVSITGGLSYVCYQLSVSATQFLTKSSGSLVQPEIEKTRKTSGTFNINAFPNPSNSYFNLKIETDKDEKINVRVLDVTGRLIEERKDLSPNDLLRLGDRYINGVYLVEVMQGKNRKTVRLVKM